MIVFEDNINEINTKLNTISKNKNIVIWGAGENTKKLLYTDLLKLNISHIVDQYNYGYSMFIYNVLSTESTN